MTAPFLTRRALTLALIAAPADSAPLTGQDQALVDRAARYLEGLREAKARFVQTDPRGVRAQGDLYLRRPGKARFAYDPPSGLLVVSDGGVVSVQNSRLKTFESYPLMATPLALFLAKRIKLDNDVNISRVTRLTDGFAITVRDGRKQAEGQLTLNFTDAPLGLVGWTVTDARGQATQVRLSGLQRTQGLPASLFVLKDPRPRAVGRGKT
jgi:outer membrane lipoprotein-sorting protein